MTKAEISAALVAARCFCGISKTGNAGLQAYFLAVINGLSTEIGTLVTLTKCQQCAPKSQQDEILAWIISNETGITGTSEEIINSSPCIRCIPPGYLEAFKTYMLYTAALDENPAVIAPTPLEAIEDAPSWVYTPTIVESIGEDLAVEYPPVQFDPEACAVTITGGGGDTFDCYDVETVTSFSGRNGGTAFTGVWLIGDSPFGNAYGDSFDTYPVGAAGTLSDGTGFSGNWVYA